MTAVRFHIVCSTQSRADIYDAEVTRWLSGNLMLRTACSDNRPSSLARTHAYTPTLPNKHETVSEAVVIIHCYCLQAQMNATKHMDVQSNSKESCRPRP